MKKGMKKIALIMCAVFMFNSMPFYDVSAAQTSIDESIICATDADSVDETDTSLSDEAAADLSDEAVTELSEDTAAAEDADASDEKEISDEADTSAKTQDADEANEASGDAASGEISDDIQEEDPVTDMDNEEDLISATEGSTSETSGSCGTGAKWSYNTSTCTLTISGSGEMNNYTIGNPSPWNDYASDITAIEIKSGITRIGEYAFFKCIRASKITMADSVKIISKDAFAYCASDEELKDADTQITFSSKLEVVGEYAFSSAKYLKMDASRLPSSIITIDRYAFTSCRGLTGEYNPGSNLSSLGSGCFSGTGLNGTLTLNRASISTIPDGAFSSTSITSLVLGNNIKSIGYQAFEWCSDLKLENYVFPDSVETIGHYAFHNVTLSNITFGKNLKSLSDIDSGFVFGRDNIPTALEVHFKGDFPSFDRDTIFTGYEVLAYYPSGNSTWTEQAMQEASKKFYYVRWCKEGHKPVEETSDVTWSYDEETTTLTLSGTGDMIDYSAIRPAPWSEYSTTATRIVIEDGVTNIGNCAFYNFYKVNEMSIGAGVRSVRADAFYKTNFSEISFPAALEELNITALYNSQIRKITFSGNAPILSDSKWSATSIWIGIMVYYSPDAEGWNEEYAEHFNNVYHDSEQSVYFAPIGSDTDTHCGKAITWSVEEIPSTGYYSKRSLKLVLSGTGDMYDYSVLNSAPWMKYVPELKAIEIGEGITGIGNYSFVSLQQISEPLIIPKSIKRIGDHAFTNFRSSSSMTVEQGTAFDQIGSRAFWYFYCPTTGMAAAIENATLIKDRAFSSSSSSFSDFENLHLNVNTIEDWAFNACHKIKTLSFGDKTERIEGAAFYNCTEITSVDLGNSVKYIGGSAFYRVTVDTFTIPDSVIETEYTICPEVRKTLYIGKNITTAVAISSAAKKDVEIYFTGDFPDRLSSISNVQNTIYYPRYNASWLYGLETLGETVTTFIPYGEEKEIYVTVKFVTGCEAVPEDQTVLFGERIAEPEITNGDMILEGWYRDEEFKNRFSFSGKVGEDMTLYARWISESTPEPVNDWGDVTEADRKAKGFATPEDVPEGIWYAVSDSSFTYNGNSKTFSYLRVYDSKKLLNTGKDYTVKYYNNKNAGSGYALLTFKGNYSGTKKFPFTINPSRLFRYSGGSPYRADGVTYRLVTEKTIYLSYTGKKQRLKPALKVYRDGKAITLKENVDYTLTYFDEKSDYRRTGLHQIKVSGKGNYSPEDSFTVNIWITESTPIQKTTVTKIADRQYTGEEIEIDDLKISYGKTVLTKGVDYDLSYSDNIMPGTATVRIEGMGDYVGSKTVTFRIRGISIADYVVTGFTESLPYSLQYAVTQSYISVYKDQAAADAEDSEKMLRSWSDYNISYLNNTKPGTATMVITGEGIYEGTIKKNFKITAYDIAKSKISGYNDAVFTGDEIDPTDPQYFAVYCSGEKLSRSSYRMELSDNINAGKGKITITGLRGCRGTKTVTFRINPFEVTEDNSIIATAPTATDRRIRVILDESCTYTKDQTKPVPRIYFTGGSGNTITLKNGTDFTISYKNNKVPGTAGMTIKFKGNFKGTLTTGFEITASDIANCSATATNVTVKKKGGFNKPKITVKDSNGKKLVAGKDYSKVIIYRYMDGNEIDAAEVIPAGTELMAEITGLGYYAGTEPLKCSFRVTDSKMSSAKVTFNRTFTYTGKEITPWYEDMTVRIGKNELTYEEYEIVGYSNNIKAGTATVTLRGIGHVDGTKTVKFKIGKNNNL